MSLYIKLSTNYFNHKKTMRLTAKLGAIAPWMMPKLWCYAADSQPDGDFTSYTPEEIALILGYNGDASSMLQAIQDVGFMDDQKLHNWDLHNAYHKTYSDRAKTAAKARWKGKKKKRKNQRKEIHINKDNDSDMIRDKHCLTDASSIPHKLNIIIDLWNKTCISLPKALKLTPNRIRHLNARLKEMSSAQEWENVFKRIEMSDFCKGGGRDGWFASFDWIIKSPDNPLKVLEGKYINKTKKSVDLTKSFMNSTEEEIWSKK